MKKNKKKDIKRIYRKRIWPSIALFFIFLGICGVMFYTSVYMFEEYFVEAKIGNMQEEAKNLGRMITSHMENETVLDAVAYLEEYLGEERDVCVTDEEGRVLGKFGETAPDFGKQFTLEMIEDYTLIPDSGWEQGAGGPLMPVDEILSRSVDALPGKWDMDEDREWMEKTIFSVPCWIEIPVQAEGYRLYYKAPVKLLQKNIVFIVMAVLVEVALLLVPILLLFINVITSIVMQRRTINLLYLDTVTGGRNWEYFLQRSKKLLCQFFHSSNTYAVVNLHMERYQGFCACYGNKAGEELLQSIQGFLEMNVSRGETFARFAKADFGLLLQCSDMEQCRKRMKRMLAELTGLERDRVLDWRGGVYLIPPMEHGSGKQNRRQIDVEQLYHYANAARGNLQGDDGQYIGVFDEQILQEQLWQNKVESTMEEALLNKEFQIYLQPKYNPVTEKPIGAEALVRWVSPEDGIISPGQFIPIFEENGFITRLDDYMVSELAKLQSEWKLQGKKLIPISVNVSRANFTKENLAQHICQLVDAYGAEHAYIELEVTESAFFGDKELLQKIIRELKMYGFRVSMDDFGAGYSSLNSLKDLAVDVLKLDMDFFRGDDMGQRGEIVIKEAIRLAKKLNMQVVAEGIEQKHQVEFLAEQGCDMIQGFYFAKPMPVEEFEKVVEF